ncbi:GNAT family N-acetyltransferase [Nakamurella endophytica]|uniref:N-acetyltransferase domain-containing protein n=1 Tax=Nakamurella endophytica TaxID=1748367 RepID=A0A917WDX7_9ACTN|nr:GNAT family N-acetyltransferase [Nakamurella endophytica]GGL98286.1 hypothetical protein GCM10011594_17780 [Nakamurella endophytica]
MLVDLDGDPDVMFRINGGRPTPREEIGDEGSTALIDLAFETLGARRVVAPRMVDHAASRRVMEKCGMRQIRTFSQDWQVRIPGDELGDVE